MNQLFRKAMLTTILATGATALFGQSKSAQQVLPKGDVFVKGKSSVIDGSQKTIPLGIMYKNGVAYHASVNQYKLGGTDTVKHASAVSSSPRIEYIKPKQTDRKDQMPDSSWKAKTRAFFKKWGITWTAAHTKKIVHDVPSETKIDPTLLSYEEVKNDTTLIRVRMPDLAAIPPAMNITTDTKISTPEITAKNIIPVTRQKPVEPPVQEIVQKKPEVKTTIDLDGFASLKRGLGSKEKNNQAGTNSFGAGIRATLNPAFMRGFGGVFIEGIAQKGSPYTDQQSNVKLYDDNNYDYTGRAGLKFGKKLGSGLVQFEPLIRGGVSYKSDAKKYVFFTPQSLAQGKNPYNTPMPDLNREKNFSTFLEAGAGLTIGKGPVQLAAEMTWGVNNSGRSYTGMGGLTSNMRSTVGIRFRPGW